LTLWTRSAFLLDNLGEELQYKQNPNELWHSKVSIAFHQGECHHLAHRVCALTISGALELKEDGDFSKSKN
jgi:hypothetical protein